METKGIEAAVRRGVVRFARAFAGIGMLAVAVLAVPPTPASAAGTGLSMGTGWYHTCALHSKVASGAPVCWGYNSKGQLGDGTTTDRHLPTAVDTSGALSGLTLTQIVGGYRHTCALSSAGRVYCWGENNQGQLGDGTTTNRSTAVAVDVSGVLSGVTVKQIAAGRVHSCALSTTGQVYCWGYGSYGGLGNGGSTNQSSPVAVDTSGVLNGLTITELAASYDQTCGISSTGRIYCWGYNSEGELGDGTTTARNSPVAVDTSGVLSGLTMTALGMGVRHTCALSSAGLAYCWGYNDDGQIGDGTISDRHSPVAVSTAGALNGVTVTRITAGYYHTCAVTSAARAVCWGDGYHGALGNGATSDEDLPVPVDASGVLNGRTITDVAATGGYFTCASTVLHGVFCWGDNFNGQLGDNTTNQQDSPIVTIPEDVAPDAPTSLTADPGNLHAVVHFTAPVDDGGSPVTGYQYSVEGGSWQDFTTTGSAPLSGTVPNLTNGTAVGVRVRAVSLAGPSTPAGPVSVTPATAAPGAPTSLTADPGNLHAVVHFTAPVDDGGSPVTGYQYSVDGGSWQSLTTTGSAPLSGTVPNLTNGTAAAIRVRAVNAVGPSGPAGPVSVTPAATAPDAPTSLTAGAGNQQATVHFAAPAFDGGSPVTGYQYSVNGGSWQNLTTTGTAPLSGTVPNLTNGTAAAIRVRAVNIVGPGGPAGPVSATPLSAPNAPGTVTATAGTSAVTVTWQAPAAGGAAVTGYTVTAAPGPATCSTLVTDPQPTTCVFGAVAGTQYTYTVVAASANGNSAPSAASAAVTATVPTAPATVPETSLTLTTNQGDITAAVPGQQITVLGTGFAPYSSAVVTIYSTATVLGTVTTDANGDFAAPVTLPADLAPGQHTVIALGAAPDGTARAMKLAVPVAGNSSSLPVTGLPVTGPPSASIALAGLVMVLAGIGALHGSRRPQHRPA